MAWASSTLGPPSLHAVPQNTLLQWLNPVVSGSHTSCAVNRMGDGVRGLGLKPSFSSPSPPARTDRLSQPARVIFNHMIARGLLSLQQLNWELWPAYSGVAGGHVSGSTPAAAGGGCWSPGCSRHPESGCLHQADVGCRRGIQAPPLRESSAPTHSPRAGGARPRPGRQVTAEDSSDGQ